jgi:hypothetical protein
MKFSLLLLMTYLYGKTLVSEVSSLRPPFGALVGELFGSAAFSIKNENCQGQSFSYERLRSILLSRIRISQRKFFIN